MTGWHIGHPLALWIGIPMVALLLIVRLVNREGVAGGSGHKAQWDTAGLLADALSWISILLMVVALSDPRYGSKIVKETRRGVAILHVVDTSGSMEAIDFGVGGKSMTRLEGAKETLQKFLEGRRGDMHGLVVFGNQSFTLAPLTADLDLLTGYLTQLRSGMAGQQTAFGDAIGIGIKRLRDIKAPSRIMVLLTDGKNNAGSLDPLEAADLAAAEGIKVYTIGIGKNGTAPFRVDGLFGPQIQNMQVEIDEDVLREIARRTDGTYFNARNIVNLQKVFKRINELEKSSFDATVSYRYDHRYLPFLQFALLFFVISLLVRTVLLRRFPL